jgi:hypothetical protein
MAKANAQVGIKLNVGYRLLDAHGNVKKTFQENRLFKWLMRKGILSPLAWKVPFLLGHWTDYAVRSNLVTSAGLALVAGRINGSGTPAAATYIAVGTGSTAANAADTALGAEIVDSGVERAAATVSLVTTTVTNDTAQMLKSFSVSGTKAVTESGVLNAASAGTLLCRQVFAAINVASGDTLQITWKVASANA